MNEQQRIDRLAAAYRALPPERIRWRTDPGADFIIALQELPRSITNQRLAHALGVFPSTVSILRNKRLTAQTWPWPEPREVRRLKAAWAGVQARRAASRQVRSGTAEFTELHGALLELMARGYPLRVLAYHLEGADAGDLHAFAHPRVPPTVPW